MLARPLVPSRRGATLAGLAGLAATVLLAAVGPLAPAVVLHGWLIAFASVGGAALGCVAWLAIHALTGGRWGRLARPALLGGAAALPVALLLVLPMLLAGRWLYPWAADPATAGPGVAAADLNTPSVALRTVLLMGGLTVAGWRARRGALGPLPAALTLVLYGGLMTVASFDWLLSLDPHYTSSAFGMQVVVAQLLSALAIVVLVAPVPDDDAVWGDWAGLMLATLMGESYLILMTLVVHWYGNLPDQAAWYLRRSTGGWQALEIGGVLIGAGAPGAALLFGRVRASPRALRGVAVAALAGVVAQNVWLVAPSLGPEGGWGVAAGLVALVAVGGLALAVAARTGGRAPGEGGLADDA